MPPAPRTEFDWFRERNSPPRRKERQEVDQPNHKPLTTRLMPPLIRGTFQLTRKPSRCPESLVASSFCDLPVFAVKK